MAGWRAAVTAHWELLMTADDGIICVMDTQRTIVDSVAVLLARRRRLVAAGDAEQLLAGAGGAEAVRQGWLRCAEGELHGLCLLRARTAVGGLRYVRGADEVVRAACARYEVRRWWRDSAITRAAGRRELT